MSEIRIEDLELKTQISDRNFVIIEDEEDTKKTTISEIKKNIINDRETPNENNVYSSFKINQMINSRDIMIKHKADQKEIDLLSARINDIISSNPDGTKDNELIDSRNGHISLNARLQNDAMLIDEQYIKKYKNITTGNTVTINDHTGKIDIIVNNITKSCNLSIKSKNLLDLSLTNSNEYTVITDTSISYTQKNASSSRVDLNIAIQKPGTYKIYGNTSTSGGFNKNGIKLVLTCSDDTTEEFNYDVDTNIIFVATKSFKKISIVPNPANIIYYSNLTIENIMVSKYLDLQFYRGFYEENRIIDTQTFIRDYINNDYIYSCSLSTGEITLEYYDQIININSIYTELQDLKYEVQNKIDKCNLLSDYGTYQLFTNTINQEPSAAVLGYDTKYIRNGIPSLKIYIKDSEINPKISHGINHKKNIDVNTVSVLFYIDKALSLEFDDKSGIDVKISSDDPEDNPTNYFFYKITKNEIHQGWNCIKRSISRDFIQFGDPNSKDIKNIEISINKTENFNGKSIYINSVIFNQMMKPTVLISFDGVYDNGIIYTYPLLKSYDIPATIFVNNRNTLTIPTMEAIIDYKIKHNWDIGGYGCHPDKELLTYDDNARDQYLALRDTKKWLEDNLTYSPISYSAPYGNLREITTPILKDIGYKIARVSADSYCSLFSKEDFAIPTLYINNTVTEEHIKSEIDYIIETGQTLCLSTDNVTNFGDDDNASKAMYESIIKYISEKISTGKLQCMTFKDFYNNCI